MNWSELDAVGLRCGLDGFKPSRTHARILAAMLPVGSLVETGTITTRVWGSMDRGVLRRNIYEIRRRLPAGWEIVMVRGIGYRLIGPGGP